MPNRNSSLRLHLNSLPWVLLAFVVLSSAQILSHFQWGFGDNFISTSLPTCVNRSIFVEPLDPSTNNTGTPPFYMIAFVVGGTPVTTLIGTDANNLSWPVTEPVGSKLVLSVVDANGNPGGIPPKTYLVIAGQTTQCVTTPLETPIFKIITNVTGKLSTCQPWGLTITGGVPPYNVTLPAVNSPNITNVTMGLNDNHFTYINRAHPHTDLLAAVSDSSGRWANGTAMVSTTGPADTDCRGLVSSSDSIILQQQDAAGIFSGQSNQHIILISVTISLLFLIGLSLAGFLYLRKRRKRADDKFEEITARPFGSSGGRSVPSIDSTSKYRASIPSGVLSSVQAITMRIACPVQPSKSLMLPTETTSMSNHTRTRASKILEDRSIPVSDYSSFNGTPGNSSGSMYSLPNFANFPLAPVRASQDRRVSRAEAGSFDNEPVRPALSDTGSNVLPGSIRFSPATGKSRNSIANPRQGQVGRPRNDCREGSHLSRNSSITLT